MRMPAQRSLEHQAALPMQAEGGFAGDLHSSVHAALKAWEKRRNPSGDPFKFGRAKGMFAREKSATATRADISWNSAPEVKKKDPARAKIRDEAAKAEARRRMRESRARETPEQREARLAKRRADRIAARGYAYKARPKMSPEERKASVKAAKKRYKERQKLGLVNSEPKKPSKLTAAQLAAKAIRHRKYYEQHKIIRTA